MSKRPVYSIPNNVSSVKDQELQRILTPLIQAWNVRNGQSGNGDEKFLTRQDVEDLINGDKRIRAGINGIANPPPKPGDPPGGIGKKIREISKAIFNDPLWIYLGERITRISEKITGVEIRVVEEETTRTTDVQTIYNRFYKVVFGTTSPATDSNGNPVYMGPTGAIQTDITGLSNDYKSISSMTDVLESALQGYIVYDDDGNPLFDVNGNPVQPAVTLEEHKITVAEIEADVSNVNDSLAELSAQYTVKIDNQGYVSGFGLASSPARHEDACNAGLQPDDDDFNEGICSRFYVRADVFAIGQPSKPGQEEAPSVVPFIVRNGKVYIDKAMIHRATIDSAHIGQLTVDKLIGGTGKIKAIRSNTEALFSTEETLVYSEAFYPDEVVETELETGGNITRVLDRLMSATAILALRRDGSNPDDDSYYAQMRWVVINDNGSIAGVQSTRWYVVTMTSGSTAAQITLMHTLQLNHGLKRPYRLEIWAKCLHGRGRNQRVESIDGVANVVYPGGYIS